MQPRPNAYAQYKPWYNADTSQEREIVLKILWLNILTRAKGKGQSLLEMQLAGKNFALQSSTCGCNKVQSLYHFTSLMFIFTHFSDQENLKL